MVEPQTTFNLREQRKLMYNVVFKTRVGVSKGALTWSTFKDRDSFEKWHTGQMKDWYEPIAQGVSKEKAIKLCSTLRVTFTEAISHLRMLSKELKHPT